MNVFLINTRDREGATVRIGEHISISTFREGKLWLAWDGGEGMECQEAALAVVIEKFYRENF